MPPPREVCPKEICIEDLDLETDDERYLRCVALADAEPGLALDHAGAVRWMPREPLAYGLWVTGDDRLALERGADSGPITIERGGRSVEAPPGKPVVLLDQDLLRVAGRRLRVHVHGDAEDVFPPEPVPISSLGRIARSAAAAVALGAAALTGGAASAGEAMDRGPMIEVRARPPKVAPPFRRVVCEIAAFKRDKKKVLELHATCPTGNKVKPGHRGELLDNNGRPFAGGSVVVSRVKGQKVIARTELDKEPAEVKRVRFRVPRY